MVYTPGGPRRIERISGQMREEFRMKSTGTYVSRALLLALALTAVSVAAMAQAQPDFSKTEIKTTKITDNFYTLEGQGGMIGILVGPDGVFMVDSQFAPLHE